MRDKKHNWNVEIMYVLVIEKIKNKKNKKPTTRERKQEKIKIR